MRERERVTEGDRDRGLPTNVIAFRSNEVLPSCRVCVCGFEFFFR